MLPVDPSHTDSLPPQVPAPIGALVALGLTVGIFALPLWGVLTHAPRLAETTMVVQDAPVTVYVDIEALQDDLAPEPEMVAELEPEPEVLADVEPEPGVVAESQAEPEVVAEVEPEPEVVAEVPPSEDSAGVAAAPERPKKRTRRPRRPSRECRPDVPEIEVKGRDRYAVERQLVDHYAKNLDEAMRLAHVAWAKDEAGEIIGFKVVRVRCGSVLHEAGFQHGDVITAINGHKVRTVPQALRAYLALRIKRKLRVRGVRKDGSELDNRYRLT